MSRNHIAAAPRNRRGNPNAKPPKTRHRISGWLSSQVYGWVRAKLADSGQDPGLIPAEDSPRIMRIAEVQKVTGLGVTSIYVGAKRGVFPRQIGLDLGGVATRDALPSDLEHARLRKALQARGMTSEQIEGVLRDAAA